MIIYNINTETEAGLRKYLSLLKSDSWLFKAVEKEFNEWIESSNPANEYDEMYFSEDAIYDKRGAIRGAIEQIFDVMNEENLSSINLKDPRLDLTCAFE